jgi:triose/dihydroxyacetone kinase / FAD-AMP lyase (cyclizing)
LSTVIISRATTVQNALDGLIASFGGDLIRPEGFPFIRAVLRRDWDRSRPVVPAVCRWSRTRLKAG